MIPLFPKGDLQTVSEPTCIIEFAEWIEDNLTVSWQLPYDVISNSRNLRPVVTWSVLFRLVDINQITLNAMAGPMKNPVRQMIILLFLDMGPCNAKRDLMGIAKSIHPSQPVQSDHSQNFSLLADFLCIM